MSRVDDPHPGEETARVSAQSFGLTLSLQDDRVLHYLDLTHGDRSGVGAA